MPDILHEVTIAATPDKVFEAITEPKGLEAWWATHAIAEPKVGSMVQVSFGNHEFLTHLEVLVLEAERKVEWLARQSPLSEWNDTHITWDLSPVEQSTKLLFGHHGYASADGVLALSSYHWAVYFMSMKDYLETGKGNPYPFSS